jgi:hypothetical protein
MKAAAAIYFCCVAGLSALIFLGLAWKLRLAPLRPGGSALALMVMPMFGILHGKIHLPVDGHADPGIPRQRHGPCLDRLRTVGSPGVR